ncbi:TPA: 5-methyltetrahydropteroyltriglutamate--homocysteine S-methyltransferase [Vibrio vulnificus]|uniref:5-methyltetrahydropteroyltriglutamate-- homocysteine S-methyltransferase n=1 Tax=Vibrio vulnificus TaxID=672 RepID=UPI001A19D4A4|nr:5-methyltetrahydropteroyltriglutamate--homocysteine S-methyltransferase [Vibrio vulnificus]ELM6648459.1 5-methyltetrahydropteroyltriglutamate--homocysteine S-methyltransferase [Vibrio vulnificus]MCJ0820959.1 5-methyltetrahydropteroyltriglutamate--homocysteine S-methyltransferase [Vibrio vulnificus]HAS6178624.1 5-methyltetrahydropteroyltriglutamate--homocysteine S-methyltransferase [Vibrio vulnificus]HAS6210892.1 5-methyltetrahydropteroyltriglutamate--homocysteine S-methyltransferase [Vibrio 
MTTTTHILGYPRIGEKRELKFAQEKYWRGEIDQAELKKVGAELRHKNWQTQASAGLSFAVAGDFAWYDHVLTTTLLLGHVPKRHRHGFPDLDTLFLVGRGQSQSSCACQGAAASDMTKWFNTNYHYIVPEFSKEDTFEVSWPQLFEEVNEAVQAGHKVKPVLLGPLSYLYLGKEIEDGFDRLTLLPRLLTAYQAILAKLAKQGVEWVQIDEPILALELEKPWLDAFKLAYQVIRSDVKVLLTTYFDSVVDSLDRIVELSVDGLHVDLSAAPEQLDAVLTKLPQNWVLSLGVVNGRNVWRSDVKTQLERLQPVKAALGERLWVASSCSLLHSPVDLELEAGLSAEVRSWFAFAKQKVSEVVLLGKALDGDAASIAQCEAYSQPIQARKSASHVHKATVQSRVNAITAELAQRSVPYAERARHQAEVLQLPLLPTTTIGSFPQTSEIRVQRSAYRSGQLSSAEYEQALKGHIADAVKRQEALDLDVLVHGEAERNDMVEYFAENLVGFQTTQFGWVQSYGSRCVKPAIVVADIEREQPITVGWSTYAQSLTSKQMKGMLTGPVTILCWTFPREDISRKAIAQQLALALRDEVSDLQDAGINIIQIDEPAIREGLPLKKRDHQNYLDWAVEAFRISAASARPETQIHTHMCYSEFNEIIESVAALDADVITIETSRSNMELLKAFEEFNYPNEIGPGVYDIHSPNIPSEEWIVDLVKKAAQKIPVERLWVNPDCGLKTRNWPETEAALANLVSAAKHLRNEFAKETTAVNSEAVAEVETEA